MPSPQNIVDALKILSNGDKSLETTNNEITKIVQKSEMFNLLTSLSVLLESKLLNQTQTLGLCFVMSKYAAPITSNPFFKVLHTKYIDSTGFDKDFIATLFVSQCPSDKSINELLSKGKMEQVTFDINKLDNEYEKSIPFDIPSVTPMFIDADISVKDGKSEEDMSKLFEKPLPSPMLPPLLIQQPMLMEPGNDELRFLVPEIKFDPFFDETKPLKMNEELIKLIQKAVSERLNDDDKDDLLEMLENENESIFQAIEPNQMVRLLENNKEIGVELLSKAVHTDYETKYTDEILSSELTMNIILGVKEVLAKFDKTFTLKFTSKMIDWIIKEKKEGRDVSKRVVTKICDFLDNFLRFNILDTDKDNDVKKKIVLFCENFSTFKEVNDVYKLLTK